MKNHDRFSQIGPGDCIHVLDIDFGPKKQAEEMRQAAWTIFNLNGDDIVDAGGYKPLHNYTPSSGQVRDQDPQNAKVMG